MDETRDNENQNLHIRTLHILSQAGVCASVRDLGVLQLRATNDITISPLLLRHLRSSGPLFSDTTTPPSPLSPNPLSQMDYLDWKSLEELRPCTIAKSKAIIYLTVCKR